MSDDQTVKQIFVGSVVAVVGAIFGTVISAIINLIFAGKITITYWWVWGIGGSVIVAVLLYIIYQANSYPFVKYRVTNKKGGKGLWIPDFSKPIDQQRFKAREVNGAWEFYTIIAEDVIYGPLLPFPLPKGQYRATFRLKVHADIEVRNRHLCRLEVLSGINGEGDKRLGGRTLTTYDFSKADEYQNFSVDFQIWAKHGENKLELRIHSWTSGLPLTLEYIRLSKRLF